MSAHTPGPWIWGDDYHGLYGAGPDNAVLEHYYYEGMHLGHGAKREPNAALIAAAPDLLRKLQEVIDSDEMEHYANSAMVREARELIDKATGK